MTMPLIHTIIMGILYPRQRIKEPAWHGEKAGLRILVFPRKYNRTSAQ